MHPRLAADPRVVDLQATDARSLDRMLIPEPVDVIVCDASFIGLAKVLPAALVLAGPAADLFGADFELRLHQGDQVGGGGLVKDELARQRALADACAFLEAQGWRVQATADSPVAGGDGNREFLLWAVGS